MTAPLLESRIKRLDQGVISVLAAGEVLHRPMNAIKELIENSIDAQANHVTVTMDSISRFHIRDDGTGIALEEFDVICHRYTTSKLQKYDDLQNIRTLGFRGEALSSLCQVARVTISSKRKDMDVGYTVRYFDGTGSPTSTPVPRAMNNGTHIQVDSLFVGKSMNDRSLFLRSEQHEMQSIHNMICQFAIHYNQVAFILRRRIKNEFVEEISTLGNGEKSGLVNSLVMKRRFPLAIQTAKNFNFKGAKFSFDGIIIPVYTSTVDLSSDNHKALSFVLFVNDRAVDCKAMRKALQSIAGFIYLNVRISSELVDVNVHPAKSEVSFLCEDALIVDICQTCEQLLSPQSQNANVQISQDEQMNIFNRKRIEHNSSRFSYVSDNHESLDMRSMFTTKISRICSNSSRRQCCLDSVRYLLDDVNSRTNNECLEYIRSASLVGLMFADKCLAQCGIYLCAFDVDILTRHLFYQLALKEFGNFGRIDFKRPVSLNKLVSVGLENRREYQSACWTVDDCTIVSIEDQNIDVQAAVNNLITQSQLLYDYFNIAIAEDDATLCSMPLLMNGMDLSKFQLVKLPFFILLLGVRVPWASGNEQSCLKEVCSLLGSLYSWNDVGDTLSDRDCDEAKSAFQSIQEKFAEMVFPVIQSELKPTFPINAFSSDITEISKLYKVFERC